MSVIINPYEYYGPYASLAVAYAAIPVSYRLGKVFGVQAGSVVTEYWWPNSSSLANGNETPKADSAVVGKLTGYASSTGTLSATDSILQAIQKLNGNVSLVTGAVVYQGTWDASTNTPTLTSSTGTKGYLYKVSVAGATALNGISSWNVGDQVVFNGSTWDKIDGVATEVLSVFGRVGTITALSADYSSFYPLLNGTGATGIWGISVSGNAATVTNGLYSSGSYSNPSWLTTLAWSKVTGTPTTLSGYGITDSQSAINGTGFVKASGTTLSYDNSTYLTTSSAVSTYLPLAGGTLSGALTISGLSTFKGPNTLTNTSLGLIAQFLTSETSSAAFGLNIFSLGNATQANRIIGLQTNLVGISNDGVLALQYYGGTVTVGGTLNVGGYIATTQNIQIGTGGGFGSATASANNLALGMLVRGTGGVSYDGNFLWYTNNNSSLYHSGFSLALRASDTHDNVESGDLFKILGNGNVSAAGSFTGTGFFNSSDIRYKDVINAPIDYSKLNQIDVISYTWKDGRDANIHHGHSAQQVELFYPELVNTDDTGFKSLNYTDLHTLQIAKAKSDTMLLQEKVMHLEQQVRELGGVI